MPDPITVERDGGLRIAARRDKPDRIALVARNCEAMSITSADLHWLVTTGGPAMIALLGGPIEGRGIERADRRNLAGEALDRLNEQEARRG